LIGPILNACKISQSQYCGAIHELEIDREKKKKTQWNLVSIFLNGAHGCSFISKKNGPPSGEKREGKKAITMKRFIVFRVIL